MATQFEQALGEFRSAWHQRTFIFPVIVWTYHDAARNRKSRELYKGALPPVLEDRTDLTEVLVKTVVRQGVVAMPFFRRTEISNTDLDAIAAYLTRNSKKQN